MSNQSRKAVWLGGALIVLLTVLAYLPALRGGFIWDDDDYVTENSTLHDLHGLKRIWFELGAVPQYYPLVHSSFWLENHLWGLNPVGYHAVNVLLQALGVLLLWRVLARLRLPGAGLAAAIFAVHPVGVESVAWITERKNVLSAVFYFSAALAYLKFANWDQIASASPARPAKRGKPDVSKTSKPLWGWYMAALLLFTGAMLSKTVACSLPAALLLVCWWKRERIRVADVLPLTPFFVIGLGLAAVTAHMEKTTVGAVGADWNLNFGERCLIAGRALWFYAGKLAWPTQLSFVYPRWHINTTIWWQWLFPLTAILVVGALWMFRQRLGRGPLVAVLFFAGTLFPALGFFSVYPMRYSFVADHFQYLAAVGLIALAAAGLSRFASRTLFILPVALAVLTWQQTHVYRDLETLWRDTLLKNPGCWLALNNLGYVLETQGNAQEAETHYRAAIRQKSDYPEALNNLGHLEFMRSRMDEAQKLFDQALQVEPDFPAALVNLGAMRMKQERIDEAINLFRSALAKEPGNLDAMNNLGAALAEKKDYAGALKSYDDALQIDPTLNSQRVNRGKVLNLMGRPGEARTEFEQVLRQDPQNAAAEEELAKALAASGQGSQAISHFRDLVQLDPQNVSAHYNLATLLSRSGQTDAAIEQYRLALRYDPNYVEAHNNLGIALCVKGHTDEAISQFKETLRLKPDHAAARNNLAYALRQEGRRTEAIEQLHEALRLQPDYPQAAQQLRELEASPQP